MSYVSLLKTVPDFLSQPIGIAAIASLGIHGAIALIVPLMPVDSSNKPKDAAASNTVGLLQLSPTDQNRLPQNITQSRIGLQPQIPLTGQISPPTIFNSQTVLPPLPPATSNQFSLPPLPQSPSNYSVSSLPTKQSLRIIPRGNLGFNTTSGFIASGKFSSSVVPRFNDSDIKYEASKPLPVNKLPGNLPQLQPQKLPEDIVQNAQPPRVDGTMPNTTAQANNPTSPVAANQPQVAPLGQPLQGTGKLALAGQSLPQYQPVTVPNSSELPTKVNESAIAQLTSYADLRKRVQQEYPNAKEQSVIRRTIPTDKSNIQGTVLGVLVVDPDGKVLDIKFQDKSISQALQLKARQYFSTQPPKKDKQISSYPFSLSFQSNSITNGATQQQNSLFPATAKPLSVPGTTNNQLTPSTKPFPELPIRNNQSTPLPAATTKPISELGIRKNQLTPLPTATAKPFSQQLQIRKNQSTPLPTAIPEAASAPTLSNNQSASRDESGQKLIEQLRELKEKRQKPDQDQ